MSRRRKSGLPPGKLTLTGARKRLGLTWDAINQLIGTGQIPYHVIDGHRYIDEAVIDAIVDRTLGTGELEAQDLRLRSYQHMMTDHGTVPEGQRVRQRAGTDEHLEIGATAAQLQSAHHRGPRVGSVIEPPKRCANPQCRALFAGCNHYCSRVCAQADKGRASR